MQPVWLQVPQARIRTLINGEEQPRPLNAGPCLTFFDIGIGKLLLLEDFEIHGGAISNFIIHIVKASYQGQVRRGLVSKGTTYLLSRTWTLFWRLLSFALTPNLAKLPTAAARTVAFSKTTRL